MVFNIRKLLTETYQALLVPPTSHVRALDGLRATAIVLVLVAHCFVDYYGVGPDTWLLRVPVVRGGWIGVLLFFVLSGYLIGNQLWQEWESTGTVRVGAFLLRRGLRIWPLYYAVVFAMIFLNAGVGPGSVWPVLTYTMNYSKSEFFPASWSLASEEQFYILAPLLILFFSRLRLGPKIGRRALLGLLLFVPLVRAIIWARGGYQTDVMWVVDNLYKPLHTNCEGFLAGVWLASLSREQKQSASPFLLPVAFVVALGIRFAQPIVFTYTALTLFFTALLWTCLRRRGNFITRIFAWRGFAPIARLSYGLYLVHQFPGKIVVHAVVNLTSGLPAFLVFLLSLAAFISVSTVAAFLGYALIERPVLQWRDRKHSKNNAARYRSETPMRKAA